MADQWRNQAGRWELVRGGRVIASVIPSGAGADVWIDARMAWQVVRGRSRSVEAAMRGVDRWIAHHAPPRR